MDQSDELRSKFSLFAHCILINFGALTSGIFFVGFNAFFFEILTYKEPKMNDLDSIIASLSSAIPLGGIFGGIVACLLSIKFGRRSLMMAADLITVLGCVMSQNSSFSIMLTGRAICGFASGANFMLIPLYIRELLPHYMAPQTTTYFRMMFTVGTFLGFVLGLLSKGPIDENNLWAIVFLIPIAFALLRFLGLSFWIRMDTAAFYLKKDKKEKALEALKILYKDQHWDEAYIRERNMSVSFQFKEMFAPEYRRKVLVTLLIVLLTQLMGTNVLNFFSTKILARNEEVLLDIKVINIFLSVVAILTVLPTSLLVKKLGRRPFLVYGSFLLCIVNILVALSDRINLFISQRSLLVILALLQNLILNTSFISAYEVLPSYSLGFQVVTEMAGTFAVVFVFPFLSTSVNFIIFAGVSAINFLIMFKLIKETKWISALLCGGDFQSLNQAFLNDSAILDGTPPRRRKKRRESSRRDEATADPITLH